MWSVQILQGQPHEFSVLFMFRVPIKELLAYICMQIHAKLAFQTSDHDLHNKMIIELNQHSSTSMQSICAPLMEDPISHPNKVFKSQEK